MNEIGEAIQRANALLAEHPEFASVKPTAVARLEGDLRFRVVDPDGQSIDTDMPTSVGGGATAPTPGWLQVAAHASCTATAIAMRAAALGIDLKKLEVSVSAQADARGLLGTDDSISAGQSSAHMRIHLSAEGVAAEELHDLALWGDAHSPVSSTIREGPPTEIEIVVDG